MAALPAATVTAKMEFSPRVRQHTAGIALYCDNLNYLYLRKYHSETPGQSALTIAHAEKGVYREYRSLPARAGAGFSCSVPCKRAGEAALLTLRAGQRAEVRLSFAPRRSAGGAQNVREAAAGFSRLPPLCA